MSRRGNTGRQTSARRRVAAVYGSDAIAGVVNFVLKDKFQGLEVRGQGGTNNEGNGGSYYASILGGTNFAQGRGNVAVNVEYAQQQDFFASQTNHYNQSSGFVTTHIAGSDSTTTPNNLFFNDIRSATYGNGGSSVSGPGSVGRIIGARITVAASCFSLTAY